MSFTFEKEYGLLIGGEWVKAENGETFATYNPATNELLSMCANASAADVDKAVRAAQEAFDSWSRTSPQERASLLLKAADVIEAHAAQLAEIETRDNGKPLRETTLVDVPLSADHFRYFAGCLRSDEGSAVMIDDNTLSLVLHEPIGVVGQIIPWNFPLLMAAWKIAPALAAGNTLVIKPSSTTPLSILYLGQLLNEIFPAGVINIVTGRGAQSGQAMLDHPGFAKLAFTGSTEVGYSVAKAAANRLIPATLELGGKSANIYFIVRWTKRWKALKLAFSSTKDKSVVQALEFLFKKAFTMSLLKNSPELSRWFELGIRWTCKLKWVRKLIESSLIKSWIMFQSDRPRALVF